MDKDSTGATGPESIGKPGAFGHEDDIRGGVTHTDTARGKGGGQLTEKADDPDRPRQGSDENAKDRDHVSPSGDLGGQDPDDVAERMKTTGKDLGIA